MGLASVAPWRRGGWAQLQEAARSSRASAGLRLWRRRWPLFSPGGAVEGRLRRRGPSPISTSSPASPSPSSSPAIIVEEYARIGEARPEARDVSRLAALAAPFRENPRRYGGYIVHLGRRLPLPRHRLLLHLPDPVPGVHEGRETRSASGRTRAHGRLKHDDLSADLTKVNEIRIWADLAGLQGRQAGRAASGPCGSTTPATPSSPRTRWPSTRPPCGTSTRSWPASTSKDGTAVHHRCLREPHGRLALGRRLPRARGRARRPSSRCGGV